MNFARKCCGVFGLVLTATALADPSARPVGLYVPVAKDIAMQLVSAAENSSLDWKAQHPYIEYNVEGNAKENRGYTGGIIGFTSRTGDMLLVVDRYQKAVGTNPLTPFVPVLAKVNGTSSRSGLGKPFEKAWKTAATDVRFCQAQDAERDRVYFNPAVNQGLADGLHELGQFIYYDCIVMHGPGEDATSFGGIRKTAMKKAKTPAQGGDETAYLSAFLDARVAAMDTEQGHADHSRVDSAQRVFLRAGNLSLRPPLVFKIYGDTYHIDR